MSAIDLRKMVSRYQENGDRVLIAEILKYVPKDIRPVEGAHEIFIASKINKICKADLEKIGYESTALSDFREGILSGLGIDIFVRPDFKELLDHSSEIKAYLGEDGYECLCFAVETYIDFLEFRKHIIIPALEHALSRVDAHRNELEIVSYINRAFYTEYVRLYTNFSGAVRLGRRDEDGNFHSLYVNPARPNAWNIVFDRAVEDGQVSELLGRLTKTQRECALRAFEVITRDIERGEMDGYRVGERGNYRLIFRYMAEKLGVEESNLRKMFGKIRDRTSENVPTLAY